MRMWRISGVLAVEAAVLLALVALTAALPGPYAGFSFDDIRQPVYRGSTRYKRNIYNDKVALSAENSYSAGSRGLESDRVGRSGRDIGSMSGKSTTLLDGRKIKEISSMKSSDKNDDNWSLISLATSISDHNQTRSLVTNFLTKSLQHLQSTSVKSAHLKYGGESLDNLILSHTHHGAKPIQMYPEGSPPHWHGDHENPSVILIEDVHPSKLPKPSKPTTVSNLNGDVTNEEPHDNTYYKPVQLLPKPSLNKPKPTYVKPSYNWEVTSQVTPTKGQAVPDNLHHYPNKLDDSNTYKPPYNLNRPTRPVFYDPIPSQIHDPHRDPVYKPVHTFTRPNVPLENKPLYSAPRPPEHHYKDPLHYHNSSYFPSVLISQASVYPGTKPTERPPPPTIIVVDSVTEAATPPPPPHNCGNIHVINNFSKEPYGECSDVMILVNSPNIHSISSSASAAATAGSGAASGGTAGSSAASVAGAAASAGAVAAAATGAVGAAAAASGAVGAAGIAGAAGVAGAAGSVGLVGATIAGSGGAGGTAGAVTPILQPLDDDSVEDDPSTTASPAPMKPTTMSPSSSNVLTLFDYLIAFFNTLPILGPVSVSLWIILLGPLAFLMVGLLGVGTFLLPWIGPRIIFGRRRRRRRNLPIISRSASRFERNLKLGLLDKYYGTRESKSDAEVVVRSDISVIDGRSASVSSTVAPTTATPIAESLKMVTKQLLQAPSATDMVATDVRTPPKVKSQVKGEITDFVPFGKGEAHPVIIDDTSAYEIITSAPPKPSTPPSTAGLSTWILLTNGEQSTLATKKKVTAQATVDSKKKLVSTTTAMPDKAIKKTEENKIGKPGIVKPVPSPVKKANISREEPPKASPLILQDSKFKNRTPVVVGRIPSIDKNDNSNDIKKVSPTPTENTTTLATPTTVVSKKKTSPLTTKHTFDIVPTTSLLLETDTVEPAEETSTIEPTTTTTKRTRRPSTKKKKKNKNRRRRPTKPDTDAAESKIEDNAMASKIEMNRPISTRIYNYLAREVMPSVGVGIVGLVLTAGLAGLFLYPFGGGVARRNYDKGPNSLSDSHMYYYNSYSPHQETEMNNAQPEEKVFGQVLSSMNQNSFSPSPPYDSGKYSASNHKYRYDMHDYTVNGYAGSNDYSTLPDSVKNGHYQASDSSKYYSMDPVSTHYKLTDNAAQSDSFKPEGSSNYPSLTEYTSYTNAASVGTISSYDPSDNSNNDTNTNIGEDKSDKSQPQFSALVGSPSFTNSDFVGSVSLTGSYGAQEVRHRTGALAASDHGPRSLERPKRDVHDDFLNEIDSTDEKLLRKPVETPTTPSRMETTTADSLGVTKDSTDSFKIDETTKVEPNLVNNLETTTDSVLNGTDNSDDNDKEVTDGPPDGVPSYGSDAGFFGFLKRLAQVKLKLGISLLRSTGEAFQRYLNTMAKRMETAVRNMESKRRSTSPSNQWTSVSSSSSNPLRKSRSDRFKRFVM